MPIPFFAALLIGLSLSIVGYLLMPKPKQPKPQSVRDFDAPTAEAGRPIPVVFGSMTIKSVNNLGYWDKEIIRREIRVGGGKK